MGVRVHSAQPLRSKTMPQNTNDLARFAIEILLKALGWRAKNSGVFMGCKFLVELYFLYLVNIVLKYKRVQHAVVPEFVLHF